MQRIAILDDYQDVALSCADWGSLPGPPEITVFSEHIARRGRWPDPRAHP